MCRYCINLSITLSDILKLILKRQQFLASFSWALCSFIISLPSSEVCCGQRHSHRSIALLCRRREDERRHQFFRWFGQVRRDGGNAVSQHQVPRAARKDVVSGQTLGETFSPILWSDDQWSVEKSSSIPSPFSLKASQWWEEPWPSTYRKPLYEGCQSIHRWWCNIYENSLCIQPCW